MQGAARVEQAFAARAAFKRAVLLVAELLSAYSADNALLFICRHRLKTVAFHLVMAFIAGVEFSAFPASVCDYIERGVIMHASSVCVCEFA